MENFRKFDTDGNGALDPYEFSVILSQFTNNTDAYVPMVSEAFTPQWLYVQIVI